MSKTRCGLKATGPIATTALALLLGCASDSTNSAAPAELAGSVRHFERLIEALVEARGRARAVLQEAEVDLYEWYARRDSIFDIEYPDGPRPLISPFLETIAYNEARHVVEILDEKISSLRDQIEASADVR